MLKRMGLWAVIAAGALAGGPVGADETAPGLLASQCVACHNPAVADNPIPLLGDYEHIKSMMLAFKTDAVPSTIMGRLAKGYTDAEIEALAREIAAWEKGEVK
jgi:sulfide dehydrogenase cytochrome subunit